MDGLVYAKYWHVDYRITAFSLWELLEDRKLAFSELNSVDPMNDLIHERRLE